jgi:ketosteroid isomerase-like protein
MELVRSIFSAWERGDYSSADWADPEIEYTYADGPSPGSSRGLADMAQRARDWLSAWDDFRFEVEEYREVDDERILVFARFSGRGKLSGLELEDMQARSAVWLVEIHERKVARIVRYIDRERGLTELGLARETGSSVP